MYSMLPIILPTEGGISVNLLLDAWNRERWERESNPSGSEVSWLLLTRCREGRKKWRNGILCVVYIHVHAQYNCVYTCTYTIQLCAHAKCTQILWYTCIFGIQLLTFNQQSIINTPTPPDNQVVWCHQVTMSICCCLTTALEETTMYTLQVVAEWAHYDYGRRSRRRKRKV